MVLAHAFDTVSGADEGKETEFLRDYGLDNKVAAPREPGEDASASSNRECLALAAVVSVTPQRKTAREEKWAQRRAAPTVAAAVLATSKTTKTVGDKAAEPPAGGQSTRGPSGAMGKRKQLKEIKITELAIAECFQVFPNLVKPSLGKRGGYVGPWPGDPMRNVVTCEPFELLICQYVQHRRGVWC